MEKENIKGHYLSNILPLKILILTKDVPTPSEFLICNKLNDRIVTIETSEEILQTYSNSPDYKNLKSL